MKKAAFVLVTLLCVSMSVTAYAQGEPETDTLATAEPAPRIENAEPVLYEEYDYPPSLADGLAGRGTVDAPDKYWAANGYPDNISFAYEAGGERLESGALISYWEIGVVNADEAAKQEILGLLSPDCLVTFRDCTFSYKQREAAFNEIYASRDDVVRDVGMALNSEAVFADIAEGYEKEYAKKYIEEYGAFVVVTNSVHADDNALTGQGFDKGLDIGGGKSSDNALAIWLRPVCLILLCGMAAIVFFNRTRLIPAFQTSGGNAAAGSAPVSIKQAVSAVKNSAVTPPDNVFASIMEKIDKARK
jgi:hypothetical protein